MLFLNILIFFLFAVITTTSLSLNFAFSWNHKVSQISESNSAPQRHILTSEGHAVSVTDSLLGTYISLNVGCHYKMAIFARCLTFPTTVISSPDKSNLCSVWGDASPSWWGNQDGGRAWKQLVTLLLPSRREMVSGTKLHSSFLGSPGPQPKEWSLLFVG